MPLRLVVLVESERVPRVKADMIVAGGPDENHAGHDCILPRA